MTKNAFYGGSDPHFAQKLYAMDNFWAQIRIKRVKIYRKHLVCLYSLLQASNESE